VTEASGRAITWGYDGLYRLTGETISGSASANGAISYTYDSVGNRLSRTSTVPGIAATTSTYDANDRVSGESFDANGDQLTREGKTQGWDSQDRLVSTSGGAGASVHVYYDGDGNRVAVDVGGSLVSYLVDDQNPTGYSQVVEERVSGAVSRAYVFGRKALSKRDLNAGAWVQSYYEQDGHGSVVLLTDSSGTTTDSYEYDAFGVVLRRTGSTPNTILYSGEWWDDAQGLQYLRARWYDSANGRFVSADAWEGGENDPLSLHRYQYGVGNPISNIDPSGFTNLNEEEGVVTIQAEGSMLAKPGLARYLLTAREGVFNLGLRSWVASQKLLYIFGEVASNAHNAARSLSMAVSLAKIGISKFYDGGKIIVDHLSEIAEQSGNIVNTYTNAYGTFVERESLLFGPLGYVKVVSQWQALENGGYKFVTFWFNE
jgi:RHS repeat-associated protein